MGEVYAILDGEEYTEKEWDEGWPEWWDMPDIPDELWPTCITCGDPLSIAQAMGGNVQCFECWIDSTTPLP